MAGYVIDTSALIAYLYDEPGSDETERIVLSGHPVRLPFMTVMEVEYALLRAMPAADAAAEVDRLLHWPVDVVESSPAWRSEAAAIKARGRISLADAWIASLALLLDAQLVHKDPEFDAVPGLRSLRLPYDREARGGEA